MRKMAVVVIAASTVACSDNSSPIRVETGGTIVVLTGNDPGPLFPPLIATIQAKQISEQIYDYLADVGPDLNTRNDRGFRPELASSWSWSSDSLQILFHINPRARWHDGHHATARDVAFTLSLNKNPELASLYASSLGNVDSVTVVDSLTAKFWFRRRLPTQFLDAAAQLLILPAHQLEHVSVASMRKMRLPIVGTGRFRMRTLRQGTSIEIVADTGNYRGRANVARVIWTVVPDFVAELARLWHGDADVLDGMRPEDLRDLPRHPTLRAITLPGMDYAFLRFNLRAPNDTSKPHPLFQERELRRAIAMSIDRKALVRNLLDTFAVVPAGPVVRSYPTTNPNLTQLPYDPVRAARVLDSLGWQRANDGIRTRNGDELTFSIIIPTISLNRIKAGVLIQDQLRRAGIRVSLEQLDLAAEVTRERRGNFDAALGAWSMSSSPDGT